LTKHEVWHGEMSEENGTMTTATEESPLSRGDEELQRRVFLFCGNEEELEKG